MENLIIGVMLIVVLYQIYSTDKNVRKLLEEVKTLKDKIDRLET